jgi:hypothetical protein
LSSDSTRGVVRGCATPLGGPLTMMALNMQSPRTVLTWYGNLYGMSSPSCQTSPGVVSETGPVVLVSLGLRRLATRTLDD